MIKELPGEKAKEIIKRDKKFISSSYTRSYPAVIEKGKGCWVWDPDGNKFLDFNAGIAVCAAGHCHPEVVRAITEQAKKLLHISGTDYYQPLQVELAEKLAEIVPGGMNKRVFFSNSGAESVEAAIKLARYATKRPYIMSFYNAFHGRTIGALSLTCSKAAQKKGFGPLMSGVIHIPFGYKLSGSECVRYIEDEIFRAEVPGEEVAAIFAEPIQGEGGYVIPSPKFFKELKKLCEKYGILFVVDEVQSGMGRTGRMFAIEHWGIKADIYCLAKGIASGMPLGATVASRSIMNWPPGAHASTFGGNPISCAASLATIRLLENELIENAEKIGNFMLSRLKELESKYDFIDDARGKGLMIAVDLVKDKKTKEPLPGKKTGVVVEAFKRGLILQGCGITTIRFSPPLVVTKEEAETALKIFEQAIKRVFKV